MDVQAGRAGEAVVLFRKALARAPQHAEARLNLAVALAQSGRSAEAIQELTPLLKGESEVANRARRLQSELATSNPLN
jgi:cytochrome c-type biogenesis protein CcmH/NrfG